ncbi:MAG TPA: cbb3-type cytochrome oxidase assembly protein CcoS [Cytophagales bacterium]|nr:cbb3-type cytochrome oxidase assembly protein CcoS [Cytophagales bacterium]
MNIIFLLIGISITVAMSFLLLFFWAVRTGQYDDSDTPARRMLFENISEDIDTKHHLKP